MICYLIAPSLNSEDLYKLEKNPERNLLAADNRTLHVWQANEICGLYSTHTHTQSPQWRIQVLFIVYHVS